MTNRDRSTEFSLRAIQELLRIELFEKFKSHCPDEESCVEILNLLLHGADGVGCSLCFSHRIERKYGDRDGWCRDCRTPVRVTANTSYHKCKRLRDRYAVVWLLENGAIFSMKQLQEFTGSAYQTAWKNYKEIAQIILEVLQQRQLGELLPSADFLPTFQRRSLETPANQHPSEEEAEFVRKMEEQSGEGAPSPSATSCATGATAPFSPWPPTGLSFSSSGTMNSDESKILAVLTADFMDLQDIAMAAGLPPNRVLSAATMLELDDFIVAGSHYRFALAPDPNSSDVTAKAAANANTNSFVYNCPVDSDDAIEVLRRMLTRTHRGISRKFLQLFLAVQWCQADRERWRPGTLTKACEDLSEMTFESLKSYVTPLKVRVFVQI